MGSGSWLAILDMNFDYSSRQQTDTVTLNGISEYIFGQPIGILQAQDERSGQHGSSKVGSDLCQLCSIWSGCPGWFGSEAVGKSPRLEDAEVVPFEELTKSNWS